MIELIFTYDYEIFGDGTGNLYDCILKNTEKLNFIFEKYDFRYVNYVEAAEFLKIKESNADPDICFIEEQILKMYKNNYEIGLHIHPQWFNSKFVNNKWILDYTEYNICGLEKRKINKYFDLTIKYIKDVLKDENYYPISFRAGNWLIQPTYNIIEVLLEHNIKIDSSVFKGGLIRKYGIDFRKSLNNGYFWSFLNDVNIPVKEMNIWEVPIHSALVPFWKSISKNKINALNGNNTHNIISYQKIMNYIDKLSLFYPLKFDFTKMSFNELKKMLKKIIEMDQSSNQIYKPIVLIGHAKNQIIFKEIEKFLEYVASNNINVVLFKNIIHKLKEYYNPSELHK